MMTSFPPRRLAPPSRQKGIAAVLAVLLIGLSLSAVVFSGMYKVGGAQEGVRTLQATTQAQMKAWVGADLVSQYLAGIGVTEAKKLSPGASFTFNGVTGVSAKVVSVASDATSSTATINITGNSAGAYSTIQTVYKVSSAGSGGGTSSGPDNVISLSKDLNLSGSVSVNGGKNAVINVKGNVTLSGSVSGIDTLNVSGAVNAKGGQSIRVINANDDVTLQNGDYGTVNSLGNVIMGGGTTAVTINANKTVTFSGNSVTTINALGDVTISGGGSNVSNINTQGNISTSTSSAISSVLAEGGLTVPNNKWSGAITGTIGGALTPNPPRNPAVKITLQPGLKVPITPVAAVTVQQTKVDAYDFKSVANYAFDFDAQNRIVVTVSNVAGVPNGTYFLGSTVASNSTVYNYLCATADSSSRCTSTPVAKICQGYSDQNSCFQGSTKDNWSLNGTAMAPGVVWFKGNLKAGNGNYYNSFIASGDIETSGSHATTAVNFAGFANICQNTRFPGVYPTNFCDLVGVKLTPNPAGNIAFLAGGYVNGVFSGGNIQLGASNDVYGSVLAGDTLSTRGSTKVHGYISVASQGTGTINTWTGSTTIDLTSLPPTFTPGDTSAGGATTGTVTVVTAVWSRYL